ncbi:MAG: NAD(P)/FAD-dependent oxidoreductase, partial [Pseudomonadota bacterium]
GMMYAATAGQLGLRVLLVDHAKNPGEKIRISGGGRCNFTNLYTAPERFLSDNPKFAISALARYTPQDFVHLVERYDIPYHEKARGQLFCDRSAKDIIGMLRSELQKAGVDLRCGVTVGGVERKADGFEVDVAGAQVLARKLVVATGGKSIPKMGATGLGYRLAEQFGLRVTETRPGLVPLTFSGEVLERLKALAGVAVDAEVKTKRAAFAEPVLFTHRGVSGPSVLQASSYWREGEGVTLSFFPDLDVGEALKSARTARGRQEIQTVLGEHLPRRFAQAITSWAGAEGRIGDWSDKRINRLAEQLGAWRIVPSGSEGYRTAEVTVGGVDTRDLNAKTLAARSDPDLHFIGEVVDVTGWLGGYNFQWAWASAVAAAQA